MGVCEGREGVGVTAPFFPLPPQRLKITFGVINIFRLRLGHPLWSSWKQSGLVFGRGEQNTPNELFMKMDKEGGGGGGGVREREREKKKLPRRSMQGREG